MSSSTIKTMLKDIAAEQSWSSKDQLDLALRFIEENNLEDQFEDFLISAQDEENEEDDGQTSDEEEECWDEDD